MVTPSPHSLDSTNFRHLYLYLVHSSSSADEEPFCKMSWNSQMDVHFTSPGLPYNSTGTFVDFFEGFTYDHVNYIFSDPHYSQESLYPSMNTSFSKYWSSEPGGLQYYDYSPTYVVHDNTIGIEEYARQLENSSALSDDQRAGQHTQQEENSGTSCIANPIECPRSHNARDDQVVWQDNIDPDNMTYEELLELGEAVGSHSRGLSQDLISLLPISKFKCGLFSRKKSRGERCVICQMEYKRGARQVTLPCKHVYHASCGTKWLSISKACPICYTEVFGDASKR